jgi:hypothetical protein
MSDAAKTVRFTQLVQEAGRPELKLLWGSPDQDRDFQRAVKSDRVLTIHQENVGTKKDFGLVGFSSEGHAQYLVFPKPLKRYAGRRVVGIKYDIFDTPTMPAKSLRAEVAGATAVKSNRSKNAAARAGKSVENVVPFAGEEAQPSREKKSEVAGRSEKSATRATRPTQTVAPSKTDAAQKEKRETDAAATAQEIREIMKDLEAGKAVVAYRRLEAIAHSLERNASSGSE